jgi:photosystem II stability/assembly factor-like uncharacterized protein
VSGVDFPSPNSGWLVGTISPTGGSATKGVILGSRDGGSGWQQQWQGAPTPTEITSIGNEHAWALAGPACSSSQAGVPCASVVLGTTTGGTTWSQLATVPSGLDQIAFSTFAVGVAGASPASCPQPTGTAAPKCPGTVLVTTDSGATWTVALKTPDPVIAVAATTGELLAVEAFLSGGTESGSLAVLVSADQGRSWRTAGRFTIPDQLSPDATAKLLVVAQGELWLSLMDRDSCAMHGCGTVGTWASSNGGAAWSQQLPSAPPASDGCSDSAPASTLSASPDGTVYGLYEVNLAACSPPGATLVAWSTAQAPTINSAQSVYSFSNFTPTVTSWPSAQLGFAAGPAGVARTEDGGQSWDQVFPALAPVNAIDAVNSKIAFGAGDQAFPNAILGTTDGGQQWRVLDNLLGPVELLDFHSAKGGYAVVGADMPSGVINSVIYRTSDGGYTWTLVGYGPPHQGGSLIGITIFPNGSGVTAVAPETGDACSLWATDNGGVSWHRKGQIPTQRGYGCAIEVASFASSGRKPGPGAVLVVGTAPVRETSNLGTSWSTTPRNPRLSGIQLLSPTRQMGWAESFGRRGRFTFWESWNGGRSWSSPDPKGQSLPAGSNSGSPVEISFSDPKVAWLMAAGSVWRTLDAGRNWLPAAAGSTS